MHVLLVEGAVEDLQVPAAAVDVLFVLHRELDHQRLVLVAETLELGGQAVEPCVLKIKFHVSGRNFHCHISLHVQFGILFS